MKFFATAARGTEGALRKELQELRLPEVKGDRGGVHFGGSRADALRACLWSRIAVRVLERVGSFRATDEKSLYDGVRAAMPWDHALDPRRSTLAVSATSKKSVLTHTAFIAQRTKDAIVDALREAHGARPDVDKDDPDVRVVVHLDGDIADVLLDVSGEPLHRRGWRAQAREAPLKETLAAALLRIGEWDRRRPLADPLCGAGTIAIEAAQWARRIAPGQARKFGAERWASHDEPERRALALLREEAKSRALPAKDAPDVLAADVDRRAVALAEKNAADAGVPEITFLVQDVRELGPADPPGHVVTNPPYGIRLERSDALVADLADTFRALDGHRVSVLAADDDLVLAMRPLRPVQEHALHNGELECRVFSWEIPGAGGPVLPKT